MALPVHIFKDLNLQREFQCLICMYCISQCYSTQCGHLFCSQCIMGVLSPSSDSAADEENAHLSIGQCPVCKRILQVGDIFPAPYVDQKIKQQIIRCLYFHKGCVWTGSLSDLKRKDGHLKHCGYALYTCKYCKEKIVRNQMVRHQNEECKSQYMLCPYYIYGCSLECRIREMEKHCKVNELKHMKLKLDYLENQLFVPEIVRVKGMSGYHNQYIEANGKYYLNNKQKTQKQYNELLPPITYKKNGGYSLEFNQNECIWHLRSLYYGLIAYGMAKKLHVDSNKKHLNHYMDDNCVWSVYFKHGDKNSLQIDSKVSVESIQLSDGMMHWNINQETDTEEINGEFDANQLANINEHNQLQDGEGFVARQFSWYNIIFGGGVKYNLNYLKRKRLTSKRLELIGIMALTGIAVFYLWRKFGKSRPVPAIAVLQTNSELLTPSRF